MSTPQPESRRSFDPVAAMQKAAQEDKEGKQNTLNALDDEVALLAGRIMNLATDLANRDVDDDDPVDKQIATASKARDDLRAMLNAVTGSTPTSTLSADKQAILDLVDSGEIRVFQREDPDAPGTMVYAFRDNRSRLYQSQSRTRPTTTAANAVTTPPAAPPAQSSTQTTRQTAASASTPAATNPTPATTPAGSTGTTSATAPVPAPTTPAPAPANPTQPAPAVPVTGSTTPAGGTGTPPPPPADTTQPAKKKGWFSGFTGIFERDEPKSS